MNSGKVQSKLYLTRPLTVSSSAKSRAVHQQINSGTVNSGVSFTGMGSDLSKQGWYFLRNLSDKMKNVSEITNAIIAAIGTGIIAPAIILSSPGKGDKEDKDKKFFQAIRQPLSAGLALLFQVPMTMAINKYIDKLAYENQISLFNDDVLGSLIPDKKYLKKQITAEELRDWEARFETVENGTSLKQELEEKLRNGYKEVGIDVSDEKLARRVQKEKIGFLKDKIAESKYADLLEVKVNELSGRIPNIKETDLVTEEYRRLAKHQNPAEFKAIENAANLSWFDKAARLMGFSTAKVKKLDEDIKLAATEKGLDILKGEEPDVFHDEKVKLRKYLENYDVKAQKLFSNKKFWFSLFVNLFMVTASCYALNWAHPRLKELIDKYRTKDNNQQADSGQKVEVEA